MLRVNRDIPTLKHQNTVCVNDSHCCSCGYLYSCNPFSYQDYNQVQTQLNIHQKKKLFLVDFGQHVAQYVITSSSLHVIYCLHIHKAIDDHLIIQVYQNMKPSQKHDFSQHAICNSFSRNRAIVILIRHVHSFQSCVSIFQSYQIVQIVVYYIL